MSVEENDVDENERGADRNGRVRDIEGPEMPIARVHVHEIDDVALTHAVDEVAHRAAENQRQTESRDPFLGTNVARVVRDAHERDEREARREQTPLWMVGAVQQPERQTRRQPAPRASLPSVAADRRGSGSAWSALSSPAP